MGVAAARGENRLVEDEERRKLLIGGERARQPLLDLAHRMRQAAPRRKPRQRRFPGKNFGELGRRALIVRASKRMRSKGAALAGRSGEQHDNRAIDALGRPLQGANQRWSVRPEAAHSRIGDQRQTVAPDDPLKLGHLVGRFAAVLSRQAPIRCASRRCFRPRRRNAANLPRRLARGESRGGPCKRIPSFRKAHAAPPQRPQFSRCLCERGQHLFDDARSGGDWLKVYDQRAPSELLRLQSIERVRHARRIDAADRPHRAAGRSERKRVPPRRDSGPPSGFSSRLRRPHSKLPV